VEIAADSVVLIHYTLKDDNGKVLDSSAGGEPLAYIQGHGNLGPGLEKALEGKRRAITWRSRVRPAEGYGTRDEALVQRVSKRSLQGSGEIRKGMQFQARTDEGMRLFTVTAVVGDMVSLDGNHPLADQTLHFDVEVVEVRARDHAKNSSTVTYMARRPSSLGARDRTRTRPDAQPLQVFEERQPLRLRVRLHGGAERRVL
jgi:FKBP-type peptidyl-prolyl cis-trans isomerase SlyD